MLVRRAQGVIDKKGDTHPVGGKVQPQPCQGKHDERINDQPDAEHVFFSQGREICL